ncbi:MAG: class I SAM-dependent RNA methyltransferase [Anaerolineaceae bacterium]|nr:class I SAM-dependent RNA methyltransferase [Anaerolineaceae bacterium]
MEILIEKMVYGGAGLGRTVEGKAVFVPYVLPGELVDVRIVQEKKGHIHAELIEVLKPSDKRVVPFCKHFSQCGGCAYQHMSYADQLIAKQEIIQETLTRTCKLPEFQIKPIIPSANEKYYRNHIQFHMDADGKSGFLKSGSHELINIEECFLPEKELLTLRENLLFEDASGLNGIDLRSGDEDPLVIFHGEEQPPQLEVDFSINLLFENDGNPMILSGDEHIMKTINGRGFRVSADTFFQTNDLQTERLLNEVLDAIKSAAGGLLLDVYCGVGLFSAFAAPMFDQVIGIEIAPLACEDFAENLDEFDNVALYQGKAEEVLPTLNVPADVMIVDPPRAGIDRKAMDAMIKIAPNHIVYVSCDLSTLARDLNRLMEGDYKLISFQPIDMFPHTQHIESIVVLTK